MHVHLGLAERWPKRGTPPSAESRVSPIFPSKRFPRTLRTLVMGTHLAHLNESRG